MEIWSIYKKLSIGKFPKFQLNAILLIRTKFLSNLMKMKINLIKLHIDLIIILIMKDRWVTICLMDMDICRQVIRNFIKEIG